MKKRWPLVTAVVLTLAFLGASRIIGPNFRYTVSQSGAGWSAWHKAPRTITDSDRSLLSVKEGGTLNALSGIQLVGRERNWPQEKVELVGGVPQPPTGKERTWLFPLDRRPWMTKYDYRFRIITKAGQEIQLDRGAQPMMVRFRGDVPAFLLVLHIVPMFLGFFFVIFACLTACRNLRDPETIKTARSQGWKGWAWMAIGGLPLGWLMNWFAFRILWEAWPFGSDVTDNKTQIALLAYGAGLLMVRSPKRAWLIPAVTVLVIVVYLIPHSL